MGFREQIVAATEVLLFAAKGGLTTEALSRQVAAKVGRQLPHRQVADTLRAMPQRFVEGSDGRWRLRVAHVSTAEENAQAEPSVVPASRPMPILRTGCFVVFDVEALGQDARSPDTELLQIAAQRWIDGKPIDSWATFVRPSVPISSQISRLTNITAEDVRDAPTAAEALRVFFDFVGDLPLIAHNGASYDGPLIAATCTRLGIALPATFFVLDTLPLSRALLPTASAHRVGTLAEYFGCTLPNAHRADADVEMLGSIVAGLARELHTGPTGAAVYELLRRSGDPWAKLLAPPPQNVTVPDVVATFGQNLTPLLPDRNPSKTPVDMGAVDDALRRAEALGRPKRPAQAELAKLTANAFGDDGFAIVEAGTGTGKSMGYLIPAALFARTSGHRVAISTFTRVLQSQLVGRELPFVQQIVPGLSYAQLQGRANYLSLARLAEEFEEALAESQLSPARAWTLATLIRFAEQSADGNLEALGYTPQALDEFLDADGAVLRVIDSVRSNQDDSSSSVLPDFYRRARENTDRADLVVVNHALLLRGFLAESANEPPFDAVVCDEAHTVEDAATLALERRIEERVLRRLLRAIYDPRSRAGFVEDCRRRLGLSADDPTLQETIRTVDDTQAALESLAQRLRTYAANQTVVTRTELERYGIRVRIDAGALSAAGGPALRTAADALRDALARLNLALTQLVGQVGAAVHKSSSPDSARRIQRLARLGRGLQRDLREISDQLGWFWSFQDAGSNVRLVELGRVEAKSAASASTGVGNSRGHALPDAPVALSGVPINVGRRLWERVWSRLNAAVFTSATIAVFGQGFDFFRTRVGLEPERIVSAASAKTLVTCELPPAFAYHDQALLMLPNDLPPPRDSELKRNFPVAVAELLRRFIPFFGGKTLALFTANSRRDFVYDQIAGPLTERGYPVLSQGHGSLQQLVDQFRIAEETSLLGSRSLWEGVDVPGSALSYVFLEKLPYPSLGDPIEAARMAAVEAAGGNPFYGYLLPKMIIVLKQGFGRLIRSATDRGAAILLDKRLRNSLYRLEVLRSLPDPTVGYESDVDLFRRIAEWLDLPFTPEDLPAPTVSDLARVLAKQQLASPFVEEAYFTALALPRLLTVQKAIWGQTSFRPGQEEIIRDVLAGKDVLTLLPTGAGKSRTYQLPALIRPGLTLVISPLIALIRDQVEKLREVPGMTWAAALVSGMDAGSQEEVLRNAANGKLKLLYVSPERLRDPRFRAYLARLPLVQLVVDEAHCISTWGHDFRPDFLEIAKLLPTAQGGASLPVHALTATATAQVQSEIIRTLHMGPDGESGRELQVRTGDFIRRNLIFRMYPVAKREERDLLTVGIVHQLVRDEVRGGAGIIYVATRRSATQLARLLRDRNIAAHAYHGGLPTPERHQIQERFMQGELDVVVATNAFGMGVDKAEIRFVLHYDHPASVEAYAQEAGRAGRDGKDAYAILLYHRQTQRTERFIAQQGVPESTVINAYRQALLDASRDLPGAVQLADGMLLGDPDEISQLAGVEPTQARVLLFSFEEAGLIRRGPDCVLEGTVLLNRSRDEILRVIDDSAERSVAETLFTAIKASPDRQATYRTTDVFRSTGLDPRTVDPLLVRLAERDHLIYRPYSRGVSLAFEEGLGDPAKVHAIEARFAARYQKFEDRLQIMLDYIHLSPGGGRCRSAFLVNYLTGRDDTPPCGTCDLCSPTGVDLPWDASVRLYGPSLPIDIRLTILGTVRDHNGWFGRWTIEKMLLGIPQTRYQRKVRQISPTARASDHFGELDGSGASAEQVRRTIDVLVEGGYLERFDRTNRKTGSPYSAIAITQKGRDALAGGISLPEFTPTERVG